eukprot:SAG31_NODE_214_length_20084_cov_2.644684_14_plen_56_part_00
MQWLTEPIMSYLLAADVKTRIEQHFNTETRKRMHWAYRFNKVQEFTFIIAANSPE